MARQFIIPKKEIVVQSEIKSSGTEVNVISVTDDGGCVMASWTFAGKNYNQTLWDDQTIPTYNQVGAWLDSDIDSRIIEIINQ